MKMLLVTSCLKSGRIAQFLRSQIVYYAASVLQLVLHYPASILQFVFGLLFYAIAVLLLQFDFGLRQKLSGCICVLLLEEGWSIRAAAEAFHLNKSSVLKMKKRWELEGTVQRKAGSGRQKISTDVEDTQLINYLRENPFHTVRDAIVNTNFPGSQPTVCRRVKKITYK
jgi:transposase